MVLAATHWIVPEQVYPWITLGSGIFVTFIGGRAVAREVRRRLPFAHAHAHVHPHAHPHAHDHVHAPGDQHHVHVDEHATATAIITATTTTRASDDAHARAHAIPGTAPLTFRSAVLAAASGNIAPCPAALVVLLAAIALHRVGYGLALIVAFSIGLAAVLTVLGIAVVRSAAWLVARPQFDRVARFAPLRHVARHRDGRRRDGRPGLRRARHRRAGAARRGARAARDRRATRSPGTSIANPREAHA